MKTITEGKAKIKTHIVKVVTKKMEVFYNPLMKFNRDTTMHVLNSISKKDLQIGLPLAGSGVRAVRILTELSKNKVKSIKINDYSQDAVKLIKKNIELNEESLICDDTRRFKIKSSVQKNQNDSSCIEVSQLDANEFLLESTGFDYIDLDPFGTPNQFLNSAVVRISRGGVLAVTATDTAPLSGTYPKTCMRKYYAKPIRNEHMHEAGLRILLRKIQLIGAQFDKALTPIFSYSKDHYFRVYFRCEKGKTKVDKILSEHKYFLYCPKCLEFKISNYNSKLCCGNHMDFAGPMYISKINDSKLISNFETDDKFITLILEESKLNIPFFYDLHKIAKKYKKSLPKTDELINKIKSEGFKGSKTHFNKYAIKTSMELKELIKLF